MADVTELPGRIVVCSPAVFPALVNEDSVGECAICGVSVRYHPQAPAPRSLVCLLCFFKHAEPGDACELTDQSRMELRAIGYTFKS
jgi:hypothetical protein